MDKVIANSIEQLPAWSFHVFAAIFAIALILYVYKTFFLNKSFQEAIRDVLERDKTIEKYRGKLDDLNEVVRSKEAVASQATSVIANVTQFIEALNDLHQPNISSIKIQESNNLILRMLNALASDVKSTSGGRHRCGIWFCTDKHKLQLAFASSGFPSSYLGNRELHVDNSIAGRCLRKQNVINISDVTSDHDWEKNEDSKSPYKSLICVPINKWVVLTVDGLEPMSEECTMISELYSTIIKGVMDLHIDAMIYDDTAPIDQDEHNKEEEAV